MKNFLDQNHIITNIDLVILVPKGSGALVHENRRFHGLALNLGGEKDYIFSDGTICTHKENEILYMPKGSSYRVKSKEAGAVYCINFDCVGDEEYSPFTMHVANVDEILKAYTVAEKAWSRAVEGYEYRAFSELYKILYELKRQKTLPYLPKSKIDLIKPATDYIHKYYTKQLISANELSKLCGISYDYLRKLFEKAYGVSPIKYINSLKIKRAKELLRSGLYSVGEVALGSGFSDLSHFSRFFKESVGVLPSQYVQK